MDIFKIATLVSPFVSASLVGLLTYYFTIKTKKFNVLYLNKLTAFKEITNKLTGFKNFCNGRIAFLQGNEFAPFYEKNIGTLYYRTEIANISELNSIFLSKKGQQVIEDLINRMSTLCTAELAIVQNDKELNIIGLYENLLNQTENCIRNLYLEINL